MARVKFLADFDYKPVPACTIEYKAGMILTVKRDCARKAIAAGKAVAVSFSQKSTGVDDGGGTVGG